MNVLAANDQENLVHALQAGAAGKSLNAGLKGFNAKTPGNKAPKTPFKVPTNDENAVFKGGKSAMQGKGKGNENLLKTIQKGGKVDDNAFVTPAGPRSRAPLGMKTTNAKARAFQTPAPPSGTAKTQKGSPRMRRPKVKVHQPEVQDEQEDDVPEVEYMPPKEVPLPDDEVDGVPSDWNFSMLKGNNFMRGYNDVYHNPVEDDGRTRGERIFEETLMKQRKARDEKMDKMFEEMMAKDEAEARRYLGIDDPPKEAPKPAVRPPLQKKTSGPSTIKAKSAVAALSPPPKPKHHFAAPTAATRSRLPTGIISSRKLARPVMAPSASRHAAATAAAKSTIGYAQGRPATTAARKPLSNITKPAISAATKRSTTPSSVHSRNTSSGSLATKSRSAFSRSSSASTNATLVAPEAEQSSYRTAADVEREMQLRLLEDSDDDDVDAWLNNFNSQLGGDPLDEEYEDFQLQLPAGL